MGRPSKLTTELIARIADHVRQGLPYADAAKLEGVSERSFHGWMAKARESSSGKYLQFLQSIEAANSELHKELAAKFLKEVREGDGKAERFLARRFAKDWSEKQTHEISTNEPVQLVVNLGRKLQLDDE